MESEATLICERPTEGPIPPAELADHPRYRLLRPLGTGGMGTVWLAEHKMMRRQVALKVIRPEFLTRADAAERFQREVHVAVRLHHPHIVAAHDAEQAGATHFLVMEYVAGENLAEHLKRNGPLPVAEACRLARAVALGLQHAHEHGLVHRDIKPHNLMLTADGVVKILDFGLAAFVSGAVPAAGLTGVNMVVGTPDYIAPEQAEDARAADIRSDIYSLGCTLYEMLTGRVPFPGDSTLRKLDAQRTREPEPLDSLCPDAPEELAAVLARMMAKIPAERYRTPAEAADALGSFVAASAARQRRRKHWLAAVEAILLAVLCLAVAVGIVFRIQTEEGEVVITPQSPDVEIVLLQGGRTIRVIDTKTHKRVTVPVGSYDVVLKDKPEGIELKTEKIIILRGQEELVRIEQVAPSPADLDRPRQSAIMEELPWPENPEPFNVDFSPDGRLLMIAGHHPDIQIWDVATKRVVNTLRCAGSPAVYSYAVFTPDGKSVFGRKADGRLHLFDVATGREAIPFQGGHEGSDVWWMAVSPDCRRAMTTGRDGTRVWSLETGKELHRQALPRTVYGVFLPDNENVFSPWSNGEMRVWEATSGKVIATIQGDDRRQHHALRVLPGGREVVTHGEGEDTTLQVWDIPSRKRVRTFPKGAGTVDVAVSGDGSRYLLWRVERGPLQCRDLHTGA